MVFYFQDLYFFLSKLCLYASCFDFLRAFLTTVSLNFLKSTGTVFNFSKSKL